MLLVASDNSALERFPGVRSNGIVLMRCAVTLLAIAACSGGSPAHGSDGGHDAPPGCGDGVKSASEQCDMMDLGGATCSSATAPGWVGVLSCTASCQLNVAGCNPPTTTWNPITDKANWSQFDVGGLYPASKGFASQVFDGRYLYFVPNNNGAPDGVVTRYDTQGGFGSSGSWETFDVATVTATAKGFIGGAFDGRYVYFVPFNNGTYDGVIARYDTRGAFGAPASWQTFDIATVNANAKGFVTATFDGRYLYLAPHYNGAYHGFTARYDTQADFTTAAAWTVFDMSTVNAHSKGFLGAIYDGRYVYYAPYYNGTAYHGNVARYDTQAAGGFTDKASWTIFNVATVNGNDVGFYGIAFDGQYLYLAQYYDGTAAIPVYDGYVARYDTHQAFTTGASWSTFDPGTINGAAKGFIGASFDGRYVYLVPAFDGGGYDGVAVRYDTQGNGFTASGSWSMFDVSTLNGGARGYHGAGFDGQYIYLAPNANAASTPQGIVARFAAKSPSWLPLRWNAAFD